MRRFLLRRDEDITGISGTGFVAEGVVFDNKGEGKVVLNWNSPTSSVVIHESLDNVKKIHCHDDRTKIIWIDCCKTCIHLRWFDDKGGQCWGTSMAMYYEDSCLSLIHISEPTRPY